MDFDDDGGVTVGGWETCDGCTDEACGGGAVDDDGVDVSVTLRSKSRVRDDAVGNDGYWEVVDGDGVGKEGYCGTDEGVEEEGG